MANKPRIESISEKYAGSGIELKWADVNLTTGSILIYRADDGKLGTYVGIATDNLVDNIYVDGTGSANSWYKIQSWDGTGSSPFSDPISIERIDFLCTDSEVRNILRLSANQDEIGSVEIEDAILDAQEEIYGEFGNPINRTYTLLSSTVGNDYWIKDNKEPIYSLDRVEYAGSSLPVGSYTFDKNTGIVTLISGFVGVNTDNIIQFEWTPKVFNLLAKNMAAMQLLDDYTIKDGDTVVNPKVVAIKDRIERYRNNLVKPNLAIMSSKFINYDERNPVFVDQAYVKDNFVF